MLNTRRIMITALFASFALAACASDRNTAPVIRSSQQLDAHLQTTPDSPLNRLPADARQRFLSSLQFSDNGLASYRYTDLKALPAGDIQQILSLFGVEHTTSLLPGDKTTSNADEIEIGDRNDMYCYGTGSCAPQAGWVCTDNC